MCRNVYKLFLIMMLALMMVGGSFLVSMANSSATDAQNVAAADSEDNQSKSDNQDGGSDNGNNDVAGGEEITSGGGTDEVEPTINENEKNNVVEQDTSGGKNAESQGNAGGSTGLSQQGEGSDVVASDNSLAPVIGDSSNEEIQVDSVKEEPALQNTNEQNSVNAGSVQNDVVAASNTNTPEDQQDSATEPDAPKEVVASEEAPEINQTPDEEIQNKDGTVTITYKEGLNHPKDTENPKTYPKAPTCDEAGYNIVDIHCLYHPDLVIQRTIETIPALGHEMGDWKVVKDATQFEDGLVERHCLREGCSHTESETLRLLIGEPKPFEEEKGLSYIYEEPPAPVNPATAILGEFSPPASESSSGSSSESFGSSRRSGSDIYTASVSPSLPIAIESEDTADTSIIEDTPIPDIIPPVTDFGSEDLSEVSGLISYLVLAIDILLAVGLVVGLGVLWKLGVMRIR